MLRILSRNKGEEHSDEALLRAFKSSGQLTPLSELYGRYVELTYGLCLKYLKNEKTAEDAVMDIFEALVLKVPKHDIHNFKSWLYTFARNHCLMQLRQQKKEKIQNFAPNIMHSLEELHPLDESDEGMQERDAVEAHLKACLEKLIAEQRHCVILFYYESKSYKEIAVEKKLEVGKVRSYIQNGRRNLKNCIESRK